MPFLRVGTPDWAEPPARVAVALGLAPGVRALRRVRVLQLPDGTPNSCVEAWFPPEIGEAAPRLAETAPIAEGTTRYVHAADRTVPGRGVDVTTVRDATDVEADRLGVPVSAPVAVLLHTAHDQQGHPLVCEEGVTPASLFEQVDTYAM